MAQPITGRASRSAKNHAVGRSRADKAYAFSIARATAEIETFNGVDNEHDHRPRQRVARR